MPHSTTTTNSVPPSTARNSRSSSPAIHFPAMAPEEVARLLLPVMQANSPRQSHLHLQKPAEKPHPDYQLYLVFNAANDLGSNQVCEGVSRFKPRPPGRLKCSASIAATISRCRRPRPGRRRPGRTIHASTRCSRICSLPFSTIPRCSFPAIPAAATCVEPRAPQACSANHNGYGPLVFPCRPDFVPPRRGDRAWPGTARPEKAA